MASGTALGSHFPRKRHASFTLPRELSPGDGFTPAETPILGGLGFLPEVSSVVGLLLRNPFAERMSGHARYFTARRTH